MLMLKQYIIRTLLYCFPFNLILPWPEKVDKEKTSKIKTLLRSQASKHNHLILLSGDDMLMIIHSCLSLISKLEKKKHT